jgi:hypothetical protein
MPTYMPLLERVRGRLNMEPKGEEAKSSQRQIGVTWPKSRNASRPHILEQAGKRVSPRACRGSIALLPLDTLISLQ